MADPEAGTLEKALDELARIAPGAPLLALGQTIFWDEPMKGGVALALRSRGEARKLIAGVHDTDYFAKLPMGRREPGRFAAVPHNDTTTRGLWSAAGEFSCLFGSETVVTREALQAAGLRLAPVQAARPGFLDEATEAWGWRGIVSTDEHPPITAEVPLRQIFPVLQATFDWALDATLECLSGEGREVAVRLADELRGRLCELAEDRSQSVSQLYRRLLPAFYEFCANAPVGVETTATTELLRFNTQTCDLPRFEIASLFVRQDTRAEAKAAYDEAIHGSAGLYPLERFGTGAIPFDLVVPGAGRGTIRLGERGAVIETHEPRFLGFRAPIRSIREFAEAVEAKFGPDCVLVGKAVTLIGMLAREFVFVFHEGASGYVRHSRALHQRLAEQGHALAMYPILRIRYDAWSAASVCCSWLRLPPPLQRAFGTEELCAPSFAARQADVAAEQRALLDELGRLRRPIQLIRRLDRMVGGAWNSLAEEYERLQLTMEALDGRLDEVRRERKALYAEIDRLKEERRSVEAERGEHFRAHILGREPSPERLAERARSAEELRSVERRLEAARRRMRTLRHVQNELAQDAEVRRVHERRKAIELEAELKRARLIRGAVIASKGLENASRRPSAWWLRLVCPDGLWFRETVDSARCYLEPLV